MGKCPLFLRPLSPLSIMNMVVTSLNCCMISLMYGPSILQALAASSGEIFDLFVCSQDAFA